LLRQWSSALFLKDLQGLVILIKEQEIADDNKRPQNGSRRKPGGLFRVITGVTRINLLGLAHVRQMALKSGLQPDNAKGLQMHLQVAVKLIAILFRFSREFFVELAKKDCLNIVALLPIKDRPDSQGGKKRDK